MQDTAPPQPERRTTDPDDRRPARSRLHPLGAHARSAGARVAVLLQPPQQRGRARLLYASLVVLAAAAVAAGAAALVGQRDAARPRTVDYSVVERWVESGGVRRLEFESGSSAVVAGGRDGTAVRAEIPGGAEGAVRLAAAAQREHVDVAAAAATRSLWSPVLAVLPQLLMVAVLALLMLRFVGVRKGKKVEPATSTVAFDDVAGCDEAVAELADVREFLRRPERFRALGARVPKGVMLHGPPGTGKTLLAKAIASEADVPFFSVSGSQFVEMFAGLGAGRVRALFAQAKKHAPCIVFIDELDAVGRQRGTGADGASREADQTLNQLLTEMDGFEVHESPIVVVAASNRLDVLDPALLRPGRFDRHVAVDAPDRAGRRRILAVHARDKRLAEDVDLDALAATVTGMTGAELANLLNESALLAARRGAERIEAADVDAALMRVVAGPAKSNDGIGAAERELVAWHETGHALAGELLPGGGRIHRISIVPRGRSGGQTVVFDESDVLFHRRDLLLDRICGLLAGRAAEEIAFGEVSSGAASDLQHATKLARAIVSELGMGSQLGLSVRLPDDPPPSEAVQAEVRELLDDQYRRTLALLERERETLEQVVEALLERETLDREAFLALLPQPSTAP